MGATLSRQGVVFIEFFIDQTLTKYEKSSHFQQFATITPLFNPLGYQASPLESGSQRVWHGVTTRERLKMTVSTTIAERNNKKAANAFTAPVSVCNNGKLFPTKPEPSRAKKLQKHRYSTALKSREEKKAFKSLCAQEKDCLPSDHLVQP
jgi:hypothetical protein